MAVVKGVVLSSWNGYERGDEVKVVGQRGKFTFYSVRLDEEQNPLWITVIGGKHDRLSPPASLQKLCAAWGGARYLEVDQGHFGYGAMRCALAEADRYL